MPKFKKVTLRPDAFSPNDNDYVDVQINVNSKGIFYCKAPEHLGHLIKRDVFKYGTYLKSLRTQDEESLNNSNFGKLVDDLKYLHGLYSKPEVSRRLVIAYKASSDISIAVDTNNNVFKNAAGHDRKWHKGLEDTHASNPAQGAYSLKVGAKVLVEITKTYGDIVKVSYELPTFHKDLSDSHIEELNKWCSLNMAGNINGIVNGVTVVDYTPELCIFFDNLMMAMAKIALQFYDFFGKEDHVSLINNGGLQALSNMMEQSNG